MWLKYSRVRGESTRKKGDLKKDHAPYFNLFPVG